MEQRVTNALAELKAIFDQHVVDAEEATRALWIGDVQSYLAYTHAKLQRNRIERAVFALEDWVKANGHMSRRGRDGAVAANKPFCGAIDFSAGNETITEESERRQAANA